MTTKESFFENYLPWQEWYESKQGVFALDCALHLTKHMLSHWPRRGHTLLQIHFDHWKSLELFWESGFDVCGIAPSEAFIHTVPQHLQHMLETTLARPTALDQLPFEDKSYDYVVLNLMPMISLYPALHNMLAEALRIAAKGILIQCWNPFSCLGMLRTYHKKSLPPFLQQGPWFTWRDICHTLRTQVKILHGGQAHLRTKSTLYAPYASWGIQKKWAHFLHMHNINKAILPSALGALMQIRLTLNEALPLTGSPLRIKVLKKMAPAIEGVERSKSHRLHNNDE